MRQRLRWASSSRRLSRSQFSTASASETERIGALCSRVLKKGDIVLVLGELGTGKTTFIRGACRALGVEEPVTSPTFIIGQVYGGAVRVAHLDLFRMDTVEGEDPALLEDYITPDRIAFIEWPKQEGSLPWSERLRVTISHGGEDERQILVEGREPLP